MELSKAIKLMRTASGMKQKEVASKLSITPNYLSLVENGKREPSISFLKKLAALLNVPVALFFLWEQGTVNGNKNLRQVRDLLTQLEAMYVFANREKGRKRTAA